MREARRGPLTVQVEDRVVVLLAADVDVLLAAIDYWSRVMEGRLPQLRRAQPQSLEIAQQSLSLIESFTAALVTAPGRFADPPLEIGRAEVLLIRQVLHEWVGYQGRELSRGLEELKLALHTA